LLVVGDDHGGPPSSTSARNREITIVECYENLLPRRRLLRVVWPSSVAAWEG